jgi:DNA-directed RNA polymerase specialized sigma24 family protein
MNWIRHKAWEREFDGFAAEARDPLLRTGYLMTGDAKDAEDLVQETVLKVVLAKCRCCRVRLSALPWSEASVATPDDILTG